MARKITMFELHFDGARFGPSFGSSDEDEDEDVSGSESTAADENSSGSKLRPILALAGVVLVVAAVRRIIAHRRSDEEDYGIEIDEDVESVAPEQ